MLKRAPSQRHAAWWCRAMGLVKRCEMPFCRVIDTHVSHVGAEQGLGAMLPLSPQGQLGASSIGAEATGSVQLAPQPGQHTPPHTHTPLLQSQHTPPQSVALLHPQRGEYVWIAASQWDEATSKRVGGGGGGQRQRERDRERERGLRKHERKRSKEGGRHREGRAEGAHGRDGDRRGAAAWRHEKDDAISKVTVSHRVFKHTSASAGACKQGQVGTFPRHAFPATISALQ